MLVTHDVRFAAQVGDAAIVLAGGRIAHAASTAPPDPDALEQAYLAAGDASA